MNTLTHLRATVEAKRESCAIAKAAFHKAEVAAKIAEGKARDERIEASLLVGRGGPRPAPGHKVVSKLEAAATEATAALAAAHLRHTTAQSELSRVQATLLGAENVRLNRWRRIKVLKIQKMQRDDEPQALIDAEIAELSLATPAEEHMRIDQHCVVPSMVDDMLKAWRGSDLERPISELRGDQHLDFAALRARILDESEAESDEPQAA